MKFLEKEYMVKCPNEECGLPTAMKRPRAHDLHMICEHCKYEYTDEEADKALGVEKVMTVDNYGEPISAFINTGIGHLFYHSPYCLKGFTFFEHMKAHDKEFHNIGDKMACCVPSGYIQDLPVTCGMENVVHT